MSDINTIHEDPTFFSYTECVGDWRSYSLFNNGGNQSDFVFRPPDGTGRYTALGQKLRYIQKLVESTFNTAHLIQLRAFSVRDAVVFPHRDFIEVNDPYIRVQLPILTHAYALHAELDTVFHMRLGEIWHLAAGGVHSACNLVDSPRVNLCLDFANVAEASQLVRNPSAQCSPEIINRRDLPPKVREALISLGGVMDSFNIRDIIKIVLKSQYLYALSAHETYHLLLEAAAKSGDDRFVAKLQGVFDHMMIRRNVGALLPSWDTWS